MGGRGLRMINREQHGIGSDLLKVISRNMPQEPEKIIKKKISWMTWYLPGI
jgi:hypothetical protein